MKLTLILGFIALAIVYGVCLRTVPPQIESDLLSRSGDALQAEGMSWATVEMDGRDATLLGSAPNEDALKQARMALGNVNGVRVVNTEQDSVTAEADTTEAPAKEEEAVLEPVEVVEEAVEPEPVEVVEPEPVEVAAEEVEPVIEIPPVAEEEQVAAEEERDPEELAAVEVVPASMEKANQCQSQFKELLEKENILFQTNTSNVLSSSNALLGQLADVAKSCDNLKLTIEGHTDSRGSKSINDKLSKARADAIKSYFVNQGISEDILSTAGLGSSRPIADNKTAEGRASNRRIEISIGG